MILRRLTANLKAQNWMAISIEFVIVVVGVFIGTQVSNWNQERLEKRQVAGLVDRLRPALSQLHAQIADEQLYFSTARNYALTALAGWRRDPKVSDAQFVIAAYQGSQVTGFNADNQNFSTLIGADQVRDVEDPQLRTNIGRVLGANFNGFYYQSLLTDYRRHVREIIPNSIQDQVRAHCGDQRARSTALFLPPSCPIQLPPRETAEAAATLRAHPELVKELDYHLSEVASMVGNLRRYDSAITDLMRSIDRQRGH